MLDLNGSTILLTGGTGSFGNAFVERITRCWPEATLRVYSRDELKQSEMRTKFGDEQVRYLIGDVRDRSRMTRAVEGADIVVHAAAMKQVPACEYNPFEAVRTNVLGAQHVVDAAIDARVRQCRRALDRQGREPGEPLRRDEAVRREDLRAGQRLRRAAPDPDRVRALRQRRRLARLGRSRVPRAARARRPHHDHRRAHDPLLDHAPPGGRPRAARARQHGGRRDLHPEDPVDARHRPRRGDRARRAPRRDRHPARREAARAADHLRRGAARDRRRRRVPRDARAPLVGRDGPERGRQGRATTTSCTRATRTTSGCRSTSSAPCSPRRRDTADDRDSLRPPERSTTTTSPPSSTCCAATGSRKARPSSSSRPRCARSPAPRTPSRSRTARSRCTRRSGRRASARATRSRRRRCRSSRARAARSGSTRIPTFVDIDPEDAQPRPREHRPLRRARRRALRRASDRPRARSWPGPAS